eukprot:1394797-Amorphochlora_amoeboformis.AAC.3
MYSGVIQSLEHAVDVTDDLTIDCIYRLQIHYNCLEVKAYTTMTKCHQLAIAAQVVAIACTIVKS